MGMVKLAIDGKDVLAPEDSTILQAAKSAGIRIPTLCFHERLKPIGSCGICVVEIDGNTDPVSSCETPVSAGMSVSNLPAPHASDKLKALRFTILGLSHLRQRVNANSRPCLRAWCYGSGIAAPTSNSRFLTPRPSSNPGLSAACPACAA
jgi:ferredoxin